MYFHIDCVDITVSASMLILLRFHSFVHSFYFSFLVSSNVFPHSATLKNSYGHLFLFLFEAFAEAAAVAVETTQKIVLFLNDSEYAHLNTSTVLLMTMTEKQKLSHKYRVHMRKCGQICVIVCIVCVLFWLVYLFVSLYARIWSFFLLHSLATTAACYTLSSSLLLSHAIFYN